MSSHKEDDFCYLQVSIAGGPARRIVIQLFRSVAPKTCHNFSSLCSAPGRTTPQKPSPTYRGSVFHRIVPQFMVQGGDFENFNGTGGHAAAGKGQTFADESFHISHDKAGIVSMANKGKNTNGSQFFITLQPTLHLNNKHVAFGQVIQGVNLVQSMATDVELEGSKPAAMQKIVIVDCGMGKGEEIGDDSSSSGSEEDNKSSCSDSKDRKRRRRKEKKKHKKKHRKKETRKSREDDSSEDDSRGRKRRKKKDRRRSKSRHKSSSRKRHRDDADDRSVRSASTTSSRGGDRKHRRERDHKR